MRNPTGTNRTQATTPRAPRTAPNLTVGEKDYFRPGSPADAVEWHRVRSYTRR